MTQTTRDAARSGSGRSLRGITPETLIMVALVAAAVFLRSRHLDWGLPDLEDEAFPLKKAFEMCGWGTGRLHLDPDTAGWPSLSFYVHMAVQNVQFWFGRLTGEYANRGDYFLQQMTWTPLAVWARWVGVLASSAVVFVGARLGGRLAGWGGALIAGLILAVSPLLTTHAQLITPDILLVMFAALALAGTVDVILRGRKRDYLLTGLWIGLGISAKYTPVVMAPVLVMAHLMRLQREGPRPPWLGLKDRRLWWAAAACVAAFVATSPFVLADLSVLARDVDYQVMHLQEGHFGHEGQGSGLIYYAKEVLLPGLGWPAFLFGMTGLIVAAVRLRGPWLAVLASFLVFYVALSLLKTRFDRYMLPALLPLALGSAGWWAVVEPWRRARSPLVAAGAVVVLAVAVALAPVRDSVRFLERQGRPGTLQLAKDWILTQRSQGRTYLAMELYTPFLPRTKQVWLRQHDPAFEELSPQQQQRWLDIDPLNIVYLPFYTTNAGASDFYYDVRHYLEYDFVVTSSAVRGRHEKNRTRYGRQVAFYEYLDANVRDVRVFAPGDDRRGPEIRIYLLTPETRARLSGALSPITQDVFRVAAGAVIGSHFQDFVKTVAEHAAERGRFETAATYYQPLYETTSPDHRDEFLAAYAEAVSRAGRLEQAEPLLRRWRALDNSDPAPVGYLGLLHLQLGRTGQAASDFTECIRMSAGTPAYAEWASWARKHLAGLETDD